MLFLFVWMSISSPFVSTGKWGIRGDIIYLKYRYLPIRHLMAHTNFFLHITKRGGKKFQCALELFMEKVKIFEMLIWVFPPVKMICLWTEFVVFSQLFRTHAALVSVWFQPIISQNLDIPFTFPLIGSPLVDITSKWKKSLRRSLFSHTTWRYAFFFSLHIHWVLKPCTQVEYLNWHTMIRQRSLLCSFVFIFRQPGSPSFGMRQLGVATQQMLYRVFQNIKCCFYIFFLASQFIYYVLTAWR